METETEATKMMLGCSLGMYCVVHTCCGDSCVSELVNKKRRACYVQAVLVHLFKPSVLTQSVGQNFSSSTCESFLEVRGKCLLSFTRFLAEAFCTHSHKYIECYVAQQNGCCSNFMCNSERDTPVRRWSGILILLLLLLTPIELSLGGSSPYISTNK